MCIRNSDTRQMVTSDRGVKRYGNVRKRGIRQRFPREDSSKEGAQAPGEAKETQVVPKSLYPQPREEGLALRPLPSVIIGHMTLSEANLPVPKTSWFSPSYER